MGSTAAVLKRLDELIEDGNSVRQSRPQTTGNRLPMPDGIDSAEHRGWYIQTLVYLNNVLGKDHPYSVEWREYPASAEIYEIDARLEVLRRIRYDFANDLLLSLAELVHAELFDDYLEMASHLLDNGYKDAAAVLAGSTCEAHLRKLCDKNGISTTRTSSTGKVEPKKASTLNDDLKSQQVYSQPQWRQIQTWLDIRNDASHGHYDQYTKEQVRAMIEGIRAFLITQPA